MALDHREAEAKKSPQSRLKAAKNYVASAEPERLLLEKNSHIDLDTMTRKRGFYFLIIAFIACRFLVTGGSAENLVDPGSLVILGVLLSAFFAFTSANGSRGSYEYHMNNLAKGETYAFLEKIPGEEIEGIIEAFLDDIKFYQAFFDFLLTAKGSAFKIETPLIGEVEEYVHHNQNNPNTPDLHLYRPITIRLVQFLQREEGKQFNTSPEQRGKRLQVIREFMTFLVEHDVQTAQVDHLLRVMKYLIDEEAAKQEVMDEIVEKLSGEPKAGDIPNDVMPLTREEASRLRRLQVKDET
jgi:hypothetical protein